MEDNEIIKLFEERDERAAKALWEKYGDAARRLSERILGDANDAEETANEALLRVWESPPRTGSLRAYFLTVTRALALDRAEAAHTQKRGGGQTEAVLEELGEILPDTSAETPQDRELADALGRFVGTLSEKNRVIFLERFWNFREIREIARILDISEGAVKMSLRRAKDKLRKFLAREGYF